ncbi:MAG: PQQ-binding-like beta-propeller repeat protein, partial [Planctomycetota bacterium]
AIDPATGEIEWEWGESASTIASPAVSEGVVIAVSDGLSALKPYDSGGAEKLWQNNRLRPGFASPVLLTAGETPLVAAISSGGILSVADLKTGDELGKARLNGKFWATPIVVGTGADARLMCPNADGEVVVVGFGEDGSPKVLARNTLGEEGLWASPAAANDAVYFRSDAKLWKIAE